MADRVALFVDAQNVYKGARNAFFDPKAFHTEGQVDPLALGRLLTARGPAGADRVLSEVRIYTGRPDASKEPKSYAAHMRQCAAWERDGAVVIARVLRYPPGWPADGERAQEKGIDVALAIDFVARAVEGLYEVGIMFSTDTDLRPAIEYVTTKFSVFPRAEVAAWKGSGTAARRLSIPGPKSVWCHYLTADDFRAVQDETDYNRG